MKDQEMKTVLRNAVDHRLSALEGNPWLARQIVERSKGEQPYMKKKVSAGLVLAIMTVIVMATAALATEGFGLFGSVDWNGVFRADESQPPVTGMPANTAAPADMTGRTLLEQADAIMNARQPGELVMISLRDETGEVTPFASAGRRAPVESMDELAAMLADAPWLTLPAYIPEEYVLDGAYVLYDRYATGAYDAPVYQETAEGLIIERYAFDPEQDFIRGYDLVFRSSDEDYHYISIYASLGQMAQDDYAMDVNPNQTVTRVEVAGMDHALCRTAENQCMLVMRRTLMDGIAYAARPGGIGGDEVYDEMWMDISAPLLTVEEVVQIVNGK